MYCGSPSSLALISLQKAGDRWRLFMYLYTTSWQGCFLKKIVSSPLSKLRCPRKKHLFLYTQAAIIPHHFTISSPRSSFLTQGATTCQLQNAHEFFIIAMHRSPLCLGLLLDAERPRCFSYILNMLSGRYVNFSYAGKIMIRRAAAFLSHRGLH